MPRVVGDHALRRDGQALNLRSAEAHYWRLGRDAWEPVLDSLVELGASAVTVYIPWEAHEIEPGRFDFGEIDPRLDLEAFLALAEERGLDIVARPGPQINGEMTWFGYPRRLLEREDLHMRSAAGSRTVLTQVPKPIPAISYANDAFFDEVASWYDAVCELLARHAAPHGRLVAVQVDNEMAYFFNVNAWAADYSDASLRGYRSFLQEKYDDLETLNGVYGTATRAWEDLDPPRRHVQPPRSSVCGRRGPPAGERGRPEHRHHPAAVPRPHRRHRPHDRRHAPRAGCLRPWRSRSANDCLPSVRANV